MSETGMDTEAGRRASVKRDVKLFFQVARLVWE